MVSIYQQTNVEHLTLLYTDDLPPRDTNETITTYPIHDKRRSENALLLFNDVYVFKILQPYVDQRYSLKELSDRHACLLEGWRWNRLFTRDIHLGLSRLYEPIQNQCKVSQIVLGKFLNPDREPLVSDAEYVLVMRKLPKLFRLDMLLNSSVDTQQHYANIMTQFLIHIHDSLEFQLVEPYGNVIWGSIEQLQKKLNDNLASVELPNILDKTILESEYYRSLRTICVSLREKYLPVLENDRYQHYFAQRIKKQQIKRCHGDLKARNIWIMPSPTSKQPTSKYSEIWSGVRVLDAIDFNPAFCNIDTLSDFAMLVADIRARTGLPEPADTMMKNYLFQTKQDDKGSRFILNYYLVEKAFVGALVSILYDNNMWLGQRYLEVCHHYLTEFQNKISFML